MINNKRFKLFNLKIWISSIFLVWVLSIVEAILYYYGYFDQLGLKLSKIPIGWKDIISNSIYWIPIFAFFFAITLFFNKRFNRALLIIGLLSTLITPYCTGRYFAILAYHANTKVNVRLTNQQEALEVNVLGAFNRFILVRGHGNYLQIIPTNNIEFINFHLPQHH